MRLLLLVLVLAGCEADPPAQHPQGHHHDHHATAAPTGDDAVLDEVARIHGAPGPWAVAGYRMSAFAMKKLGLERGSFDLEIIHHTPRAVKYSCIADGAAAQSGASVGKLNLSLVEAAAPVTEFKNKKTGQAISLRPTTAFADRFATFPEGGAREAGRQVLSLRDDEIFEEAL